MREHRVYYGRYQCDHYFVEVKKDRYDEWSVQDIRNISHRSIVKWLIRERDRRARVILVAYSYFKEICGDTVKLLKVVKSS